jgi:hypothetical protein
VLCVWEVHQNHGSLDSVMSRQLSDGQKQPSSLGDGSGICHRGQVIDPGV